MATTGNEMVAANCPQPKINSGCASLSAATRPGTSMLVTDSTHSLLGDSVPGDAHPRNCRGYGAATEADSRALRRN